MIAVLMQNGGEGVKVMLMEPTLALLRHLRATSRILWTLSTNQRDKSSSQVAFWLGCWIFLSICSLETSELCGCGPWCCLWGWQVSLIVDLIPATSGAPVCMPTLIIVEGTEGEKSCFCHLLRFCIFWEKGIGERDQLTCSYSAE